VFLGLGRHPELTSYERSHSAYMTAGACLNLYTYLDRLEERAIYCDTVSVVYVQPREGPALDETGDNLGAMTSELKPSEYM